MASIAGKPMMTDFTDSTTKTVCRVELRFHEMLATNCPFTFNLSLPGPFKITSQLSSCLGNPGNDVGITETSAPVSTLAVTTVSFTDTCTLRAFALLPAKVPIMGRALRSPLSPSLVDAYLRRREARCGEVSSLAALVADRSSSRARRPGVRTSSAR